MKLVEEKTTRNYQQEFRKISMTLSNSLNKEQWYNVFKKLTYWELELEKSGDDSVEDILSMQKTEANTQFFKFIKNNYKTSLLAALGNMGIVYTTQDENQKALELSDLLSKKRL